MNSTEPPVTTFHGIPIAGTSYLVTWITGGFGRPAEGVQQHTTFDAARKHMTWLNNRVDGTGQHLNSRIRMEIVRH
jgi:hypothetical protein